MGNVNTELKKQEHFRELMYSFNWIPCLEEQLAHNFSNEQAVQYIEYIIEHLTPQYKQAYLENIYHDASLFDKMSPRDYVDGNTFAGAHAHLRFLDSVEKELHDLIPLLIKKKEEKRLDVKLSEKVEQNRKVKQKYGYTGLKLLVENNYNEVINEFYKISKEYKLISDITSLADFKRIFKGVNVDIPLDNRVIWLKSVPALKKFIMILTEEHLIEKLPRQGHWLILSNCFRNRDERAYTPQSFKNNSERLLKDDEDAITKALKDLIYWII